MILNYAKEITPTSINLKMASFTNSIMSLNQSQPVNNPVTFDTGTTAATTSNNPLIDASDSTASQADFDNCQKNELIDLYNFVFQEDETADLSQLNAYFPDNSYLKPNHVDVPCSKQPKEGSAKQFCLNEVDAFFKNNSKPVITSSSNDNEKSTSAGNHPIIHEYKESSNGLIGYETYESSYMHF